MDDGNGRMGRAVGDLALARAESERYMGGTAQRYYSLSAQIQRRSEEHTSELQSH